MRAAIEEAAVIVPACNEEQLLPGCLEAIRVAARGLHVPVRTVVALDSCVDGTAAVCRGFGVDTVAIEAGNVGLARRAATDLALGGASSRRGAARLWLAHTDADSQVEPDWLQAQLTLADRGADAVLGVVDLADGDGSVGRTHRMLYARKTDPDGTHGHIHGASLGVRGSTYMDTGGFPPTPEHEDRLFVERLRSLDHVVLVRSTEVRVKTSGRTVSRCAEGFGARLASLAQELAEPA